MSFEHPLLSIAIPTYNRAKYLKYQLVILRKAQSLRRTDLEVIVANNGSTDRTSLLLKQCFLLG
jgi:abequosyltransferase